MSYHVLIDHKSIFAYNNNNNNKNKTQHDSM